MLLLITYQSQITNEVEILRKIAAYDWVTIHVRKPKYTLENMKKWLTQFSTATTQKMVLHQHHQLAEYFPIKGIHFKEIDKQQVNRILGGTSLTMSASYHDLIQAQHQTQFDYSLLSPVFDSISKENLGGKNYQISSSKAPIIALGGIEVKNIGLTHKLGYHGVAVLGSVWQSQNPLKAFKAIHQKYQTVYE